jgi:hypothetical protein
MKISGDVISMSVEINRKIFTVNIDRRLMQVGGFFVFGLLVMPRNSNYFTTMQIELMAIQIVLSRWLQRPDAPICEINPHSGDKRNRPYAKQEIEQMREFLKRHSWGSYIGMFYNEGPRIVDSSTYHR